VLFSILLGTIALGEAPSVAQGGLLLAQEAGGGVVFGLVLGYVTFRLLKSIDSYKEEVLLTLAAVLGGYLLASRLHVSGPLAMVVAGLVIGNHGRATAMSDKTRAHLDMFWELLDEILNSVLFLLIGLEVLVLRFEPAFAGLAAASIPVVLLARLLAVAVPVGALQSRQDFAPGTIPVLTWGGLRGGISIALVLSIPEVAEKAALLAATYAVVVFAIVVQGLTLRSVVERMVRRSPHQAK
jgi:CPA1 family monovalent cation:H+ antiporter